MVFPNQCPLDKYVPDPTGITGSYENDPVEACVPCNFADHKKEDHCQCPSDMTWGEYDRLRESYIGLVEQKSVRATKPGFQEFVRNERDKNSSKKD